MSIFNVAQAIIYNVLLDLGDVPHPDFWVCCRRLQRFMELMSHDGLVSDKGRLAGEWFLEGKRMVLDADEEGCQSLDVLYRPARDREVAKIQRFGGCKLLPGEVEVGHKLLAWSSRFLGFDGYRPRIRTSDKAESLVVA